MSDVYRVVGSLFEERVPPRSRVCVALSGGVDSVVLLDALMHVAGRYQLQLSAVHVNHGLSPASEDWVAFCTRLCAQHHVALEVRPVVVTASSGLGIEATARAARYEVFGQVEADFLALAHHLDDQAETFLLQLLRGAGAQGLSAMPVERHLGIDGPRLLRPFLQLTRSELEGHAVAHSLEWIEDESNALPVFDRNYLRHAVLPIIERRFPAYRRTLARASRNLAESATLVEILGRQDLADVQADDGGLRLGMMEQWPETRVLNVLRCLFRDNGQAMPRRGAIREAARQALQARRDAQVRIDFGDLSLRRYRGKLYLVDNLGTPGNWRRRWRGEATVVLPDALGELRFRKGTGTGLSAEALGRCEVSVAFGCAGARVSLAPNRPHRDLRKLWQEAGVAPWVRQRTPLLLCGEQVAFIPGLGAAAELRAREGEESWDVQFRRRMNDSPEGAGADC
jgi:tRNA(Ile)-lysidine synthase